MSTETRIGWTQPLCGPCFAAWTVGRGDVPREPTRVRNAELEPCLICGEPTNIYVRIDPALAGHFEHAKAREP